MAAPRGNQYAKKAKLWTDAIKRALVAAVPHNHKSIDGSRTLERGLDMVAEKVVAAAMQGDQWCIAEIGNRLEGKPAQSLEIGGSVNLNHAALLTDDELAVIATGGSLGTAEETPGEDQPPELH